MTDIFKTVILTAATKTDDTTAALSATGEAPATHYIGSGFMPEDLIAQLQELPDADVSDDEPFVALDRLGLKLVSDGTTEK
jgi:hypothetical protein